MPQELLFTFPNSETITQVYYHSGVIDIFCKNPTTIETLSKECKWEEVIKKKFSIQIPLVQRHKDQFLFNGERIPYEISSPMLAKWLVDIKQIIKEGTIYERLLNHQVDTLEGKGGVYGFDKETSIKRIEVLFRKEITSLDWVLYNRYAGEYRIYVQNKEAAEHVFSLLSFNRTEPQQEKGEYYISIPIQQVSRLLTLEELVKGLSTSKYYKIHSSAKHSCSKSGKNCATQFDSKWSDLLENITIEKQGFSYGSYKVKPIISEASALQKL